MSSCVQYRAALRCRPPQERFRQHHERPHGRSVRREAAHTEGACRESAHQDATPSNHPSSDPPACSFLASLSITNFALVAQSTIEFQPGLNVISGASGSGKSVLLQALGVVLGMPVDKDMIRDQDNMAVVEATFQLAGEQRETASQLLEAVGIPKSVQLVSLSGELVIRREIQRKQANNNSTGTTPDSAASSTDSDSSDSAKEEELSQVNKTTPVPPASVRSTVFINGAATPLRNARALGASLVDVNSQNAAAALRSPAAQLALLDRLAHCAPLAREFAGELALLESVQGRLEELGDFEDVSLRHNEQAMLGRIDALEVVPGEEEELQRRVARLNTRMGAVQAAVETHATIGARGEERTLLGLLALVSRRMANLRQRVDFDVGEATSGHTDDTTSDTPMATLLDTLSATPSSSADDEASEAAQRASLALLEEAASNLYQAEGLLEGSKGRLEEFVESLEQDADTYTRVKARLQSINELLADTDCSTTHELLACADDTRTLLADWDSVAEELPQLRQEERRLKSALVDTGTRLSAARRRASGHLRQAVEASLQQLAMAQSRFDVRIGWEASYATGSRGVGGNSMHATGGQPARMHVPLFIGDEAQALGEAPGQEFKAWASGLDKVEFLLAAGPAEPLQPLRNVASGGESARVMLALKAAPSEAPSAFSGLWDSGGCLDSQPTDGAQQGGEPTMHADTTNIFGVHDSAAAEGLVTSSTGSTTTRSTAHDAGTAEQQGQGVLVIEPPAGGASLYPWTTVHGGTAEFDGDTGAAERALGALASPVLVLDEVDAGTGARLGASVAQLLRRLAASSGQVLCVSHVPQVAAYAERHILVEKTMHEERPLTGFRVLDTREARVAEVADMLGLDPTVAEDMLDTAQRN